MSFAVSPHHSRDEFPNGFENIDQKIEIFIDRVEYWQLGVAKELVDRKTAYRTFAILNLLLGYFELIARYSADPYNHVTYKNMSGVRIAKADGAFFRVGVKMVFPDIPLQEEVLIAVLYARVRHGIYDLAVPDGTIVLDLEVPQPLVWNVNNHSIVVNPDKLVQLVIDNFKSYSAALRDPGNTELRQRFEARFDADNS